MSMTRATASAERRAGRGRAEPQPAQNSEPWALKVLESKLCTQIFGFTYTRAHGPSLAGLLSLT